MYKYLALLILPATFVAAQTKELPADIQVKLLKDQNRIRTAQTQEQAVVSKYQNLVQKFNQTPEIVELQKQDADIRDKRAAAEKQFQTDKDDAFKQAGIDPKAYDLDSETLEFSPKASPAPVTPSPGKK